MISNIVNRAKNRQNPKPVKRVYELHTIDTMPLAGFIKCYENPDYLNPLVISGNPPHEKLAELWQDMSVDFTDRMSSEKDRRLRKLEAKLIVLEAQQRHVNELIELLEQGYRPEIAQLINESTKGFTSVKVTTRKLTEESYKTDLVRVKIGVKSFALDIAKVKGQIEELRGESKKPEEPETKLPLYQQIDKLLTAISDMKQREITIEELTVGRFTNHYQSYLARIEHLEQQRSKRESEVKNNNQQPINPF